MLELELNKAECTLEALTCRTEKHGTEDIPAVTLRVSASCASNVLAFFSPTLEAHLFDKDNVQKDLLGDGAALRYPHIKYPINLDHEMLNAEISIDYGVSEPMVYGDVRVDKFQLTPMAGGSVILEFNLGFKATDAHVAKLYLLQRRKMTLSLEPAEEGELQEAA